MLREPGTVPLPRHALLRTSNVETVRRPTADLMLLTTVCLWALNFTASKYLITHGISPLAYASPRYVIAAAMFVLLTLVLERSLRMGRRDLAVLAGTAVVLFFNQLGFIYALALHDRVDRRARSSGRCRSSPS